MTPEYKEPVALDPKGLEAALRECRDKLWIARCDSRDEAFRKAAENAVDMGTAALTASPSVREIGEPVAWLWYGEDENGQHVTFGRWQQFPCQRRYKLAEVQPTEHDHPTPAPQAPATPPAPAAVLAVTEANDLRTEVARKLPADFPNYADWPVTLPAGHWRALTATPPAPSGVVEALRAQIDAEHSKVIGDDGYNYAAGQEYGLRLALIIIDKALAAIEEQAGWREPDRWRAKFNLWFFRELSDEQRLKLFSLHGLPVDEIGLVHGFQRKALDCCLPVSPKQEMK